MHILKALRGTVLSFALLSGATACSSESADPEAGVIPPEATTLNTFEPEIDCEFSKKDGGYLYTVSASSPQARTRMPFKAWAEQDLDNVLRSSIVYGELNFIKKNRKVSQTIVIPASSQDRKDGYTTCRITTGVERGE